MANAAKYTWTGVWGMTWIFALINMIIAAILVRSYNHSGYPSTHLKEVIRYTLFVGVFNVIFGFAWGVFTLFFYTSIVASVLSNLGMTFLLWVLWLASAASTQTALGTNFSCGNPNVAHCHQLLAMEAFAWINFIVFFFSFLVVAFIGWRSSRAGAGGFSGPVALSV